MIEYRSFRAPHVLTDELNRFLRSQAGNDFKTLSSFFPAQWKLVVMGGLLRDLFLDRTLSGEAGPADMDIVIFGACSLDEIREKLGKTNQTTNSFGGAKCRLRPKGMIFDLWRIEDHANMATARNHIPSSSCSSTTFSTLTLSSGIRPSALFTIMERSKLWPPAASAWSVGKVSPQNLPPPKSPTC